VEEEEVAFLHEEVQGVGAYLCSGEVLHTLEDHQKVDLEGRPWEDPAVVPHTLVAQAVVLHNLVAEAVVLHNLVAEAVVLHTLVAEEVA
jgi:hypothetical protein